MRCRWLMILCLSTLPLLAQKETLFAIYPKQGSGDTRDYHKIELMEKAFTRAEEKFGKTYISPTADSMNEARMMLLMLKGSEEELNILFKPTSKEREEQMIPVRIPIIKGLLGHRVFLIHHSRQAAFFRIRSLKDLQRFTVGQGRGWTDVSLLEHNGIEVVLSPQYETLFAMLNHQRFDFFSRGVTEAPQELQERAHLFPDMRIESDLMLHYPFPVYFFTKKSDSGKKLAQRLEYGLEQMIKDGSFDRLFFKYYRKDLQKLNLKQRRIIKIENPFLPDTVPLNRKELWLDIEAI